MQFIHIVYESVGYGDIIIMATIMEIKMFRSICDKVRHNNTTTYTCTGLNDIHTETDEVIESANG